MLTASDLLGLYGMLPTPAKAGAERWEAVDTVDLEETERLVNKLIGDGVSGLVVLGTTGECATLTEQEYQDFVDCFLSVVGGRVPTFVGATAMGTHAVVSRLRFASERGADGTLLGLPMWQPCTGEMALAFYESISQAFPDLAIMVYGNPGAFRYDYPTAFWAELTKRAPTVSCAKFGRLATYGELLDATKGRINFMPIDQYAYEIATVYQESLTACWATAAGMGPQPSIALIDAIRANRLDEAERISREINEACAGFLSPAALAVFPTYNIQLEKLRIQAAGYCDPGPVRPPYNVIPEELAAPARECGRRWAELVKKYQG